MPGSAHSLHGSDAGRPRRERRARPRLQETPATSPPVRRRARGRAGRRRDRRAVRRRRAEPHDLLVGRRRPVHPRRAWRREATRADDVRRAWSRRRRVRRRRSWRGGGRRREGDDPRGSRRLGSAGWREARAVGAPPVLADTSAVEQVLCCTRLRAGVHDGVRAGNSPRAATSAARALAGAIRRAPFAADACARATPRALRRWVTLRTAMAGARSPQVTRSPPRGMTRRYDSTIIADAEARHALEGARGVESCGRATAGPRSSPRRRARGRRAARDTDSRTWRRDPRASLGRAARAGRDPRDGTRAAAARPDKAEVALVVLTQEDRVIGIRIANAGGARASEKRRSSCVRPACTVRFACGAIGSLTLSLRRGDVDASALLRGRSTR